MGWKREPSSEGLSAYLTELDRIEDEVNKIATPLAYADQLYNLRMHINLVREKLTKSMKDDWLIPGSPWFIFAIGRYDYDQFESWRHRVAGHVGPGYDVIESEKVSLDLRAGVGPRKEWGSEDDEWKPEGLLGLGFDWKITPRLRFDVNSGFFPTLNDTDDYRSRTTANWVMKVAEDLDLSVIAGLAHEFQNIVDPDKRKNDLRVFTGLQFDF